MGVTRHHQSRQVGAHTCRSEVHPVVPAADTAPAEWRYTTTKPDGEWFSAGFDDSAWQVGRSGFGTPSMPAAIISTKWETPDIWLRREIELPVGDLTNLKRGCITMTTAKFTSMASPPANSVAPRRNTKPSASPRRARRTQARKEHRGHPLPQRLRRAIH